MRIFIILLLLNFHSFGYTAEVADVAMVDAEIASPRTPDQGDHKQRPVLKVSDNSQPTAPVECTIEKANTLAEWFCESHLAKWAGSFYRAYYQIEYKEIADGSQFGSYVVYLRRTDSEINYESEGRPATTFKVTSDKNWPNDMYQLFRKLERRYLKEDMVSQMTDTAFQRAGIFPGLTFFNMVVQTETRKEQANLNRARTLLPDTYNAEFVKPEMPSAIRPYSFLRTFELYLDTHIKYVHWISSLSEAIKDLQPFYNAVASDSEIIAKHTTFIKSISVHFFDQHTPDSRLISNFITQLIGLYKYAVARLGDQGIGLLDSVQGTPAASLINLTKVNNETMGAFLARFKDYLSERNKQLEQLNIEQLR